MIMIEAEQCPYWDKDDERYGIFALDEAHYLPKVQEWFAELFFDSVCKADSVCTDR